MQSKFPMLLTDQIVTLDEIIAFAQANKDVHKVYKTVVDSESQLRLNWALMSLEDLDIAANYKGIITDIAQREIPTMDTFKFKKMFMEDKIYAVIPNVDSWLSNSFGTITAFSKQ
jgi:hypothetical protein